MEIVASYGDHLIVKFTAKELPWLRESSGYNSYWKRDSELLEALSAMVTNNRVATKIAVGEWSLLTTIREILRHIERYAETTASLATDRQPSKENQ